MTAARPIGLALHRRLGVAKPADFGHFWDSLW